MKKKLILTLSFLVLINVSPNQLFAESIDKKIENKNKKIEEIIKTEKQAKKYLDTLENEIASIETEYQNVLAQKQASEEKMNQMNQDIETLEIKIQKRKDQLNAQARVTQTNQAQDTLLTAILNAESISDAITKALAVNTLIKANNDILSAQKDDKQELEEIKVDLMATIESLENNTKELKEKEAILAEKKLDQNVKVKEIAAALATEQTEKEKYLAEKAEEERKKEQQLKEIAEEQERQKLAQEAAEKAAQEAAEKAALQGTPSNSQLSEVPESTTTLPTTTAPQQPSAPSVSGGWSYPVASAIVTSGFGHREDPTGISGTFHDGIDFGGTTGTPIMASRSGQVVTASYGGMAGNHVIIQHDNGYYSYYLHMNSLNVTVGQNVSAGQVVGGMGTTGNSTGVHLHFSISTGLWSGFIDPSAFL